MRLFITALCMIATLACCGRKFPETIHIEGGKLHVQGIALDQKKDLMYCSFTSAFFKTDLNGRITGSVTGINGHLGAMTFDPESRRVYASLEIKSDAIGRGISDAIGAKRHEAAQSVFYIAEIEVDKIDSVETPFEDVIKLHPVADAAKDHMAEVQVDGRMLKHRYGCSGIDGITIGPGFGDQSSSERYIYVAYGIYGDTLRCDNDHNILLAYRLDNLAEPEHKYFIHTGNTRYGVQNLAYDKHTEKVYLAVYNGRKSQYPNYSLFALDINQKPYKARLKDVPYQTEEVEHLDVCGNWMFRWGSTGLCPLGDGRYYISENGKTDKGQYCNATLYFSSDSEESPFERR